MLSTPTVLSTASLLTKLIGTVVAGVLLHPVHQTVSEVEWNPKTNCVEVALRLDMLDEQWIEKQQTGPKKKGWQADYLKSRLMFDPVEASEPGKRWVGKPIRWVGRKEEGGYTWWFFEVVCQDGRPPQSIRTRLLFDREPGYDHRVILLGCVKRDGGDDCSLVLNESRPQAQLSLQMKPHVQSRRATDEDK